MSFDEVGVMYACLWMESGWKRFQEKFVDWRSFQSRKRCDVLDLQIFYFHKWQSLGDFDFFFNAIDRWECGQLGVWWIILKRFLVCFIFFNSLYALITRNYFVKAPALNSVPLVRENSIGCCLQIFFSFLKRERRKVCGYYWLTMFRSNDFDRIVRADLPFRTEELCKKFLWRTLDANWSRLYKQECHLGWPSDVKVSFILLLPTVHFLLSECFFRLREDFPSIKSFLRPLKHK